MPSPVGDRTSNMALTLSPSGDAVAFGWSDQVIRIVNLQDASPKSIKTPYD
jgi:WD40 repeat protein